MHLISFHMFVRLNLWEGHNPGQRCGWLGIATCVWPQASTSGDMYFVDAQGDPTDVRNRRTATITCNGISLEEDFIVASVTCPLVALGHLMRMGWQLTTDEHGMNLVRGSDRIAVGLKRNSLCIRQAIRVLQRPEGQPAPLRVITLTPTLSGMRWSWQKLGPHCLE